MVGTLGKIEQFVGFLNICNIINLIYTIPNGIGNGLNYCISNSVG